MNVTSMIEVDLSGYVDSRGALDLWMDDRTVREVWRSVGGVEPGDRVRVDVGSARAVSWDPRIVEALSIAESVLVTGSDRRGVVEAAELLRQRRTGAEELFAPVATEESA